MLSADSDIAKVKDFPFVLPDPVSHCLMVQRAICFRRDEVEPVVQNKGLLHLGCTWLTSRVLGELQLPASCSFFKSRCATVIVLENKRGK